MFRSAPYGLLGMTGGRSWPFPQIPESEEPGAPEQKATAPQPGLVTTGTIVYVAASFVPVRARVPG